MLHFDCHAHVYERVFSDGAPRYLPDRPAPLEDWLRQLKAADLLGGVVVQTSFFGTDNTELLAALSRLDRTRFCGVAALDWRASEEKLAQFVEAGVRGVRWNLVEGAPLPDLDNADVLSFLGRLNRIGLHLELHLESPGLAHLLPKLAHRVNRIVIDHFGLPVDAVPQQEPWLNWLRSVSDRSGIWVKFSAPYRSRVAVSAHAEALLELLGPGQIVWGSDRPWTRHEGKFDYGVTLDWARAWLGDDFSDNTAASDLYGISHHAQKA